VKARPVGYLLGFALLTAFAVFGLASTYAEPSYASNSRLALSGPTASADELEKAQAEWEITGHSDTYDNGLGADTTCARCKSPLNWDPSQDLAAQAALDCGSCKRTPGAPRPALAEGVPVPEDEWESVTCAVCHVPVGDTFEKTISFWNQELGLYEPIESTSELCAKCHEGQHGFEVVEEQLESDAHSGWECTACHGNHGMPASCTDCHNPTVGSGAPEHARHPSVNCTGCHDQGRLSVWQDPEESSRHFGEYITRRFAHTLTSWPSHDLSRDVDCVRCHHPLSLRASSIVPEISCQGCHEDGAVSLWCIYFQRDPDPSTMQAEVEPHP